MDAFNDRHNEMVVVMTSAQIGKTEVLSNVLGYFVDQDPSPVLIVYPTDEIGEAYSKDRLQPMIRDTPTLAGKIKEAKGRDSGNTILHKHYPGGTLTITGSNSPAKLSSRPIRILLCDEIDKYPPSAGKEGDPVTLAVKRTERFWNRRIGLFCTPTVEGESRIQTAFNESDQRKFYVPCPDCGQFQILVWEQVKWPKGEPHKAYYQCIGCQSHWADTVRWKAITRGHWQATALFKGVAGFHVWEAYGPAARLSKIAKEFLEARKTPDSHKTWTNTTLGETWKETGDVPDYKRLYLGRETYEIGTVPAKGLFLTCGVDVQIDRIEALVIAWGRGKENWSIERRIFEGRTNEAPVWEKLTAFLSTTYIHESGLSLHIARVGIDTGFNTQHVYTWLRRQGTERIIGIKGNASGAAALGTPIKVDVNRKGKKVRRSVRVWPVNVSMLKFELYGWLRLDRPTDEELAQGKSFPPGYCHFPQEDEEFFKQLTAEQLVTRTVRHAKFSEWVQRHDRNEVLDMRNYARAAAAHIGMDRFTDGDWKILETSLQPPPDEPEPEPTPQFPYATVPVIEEPPPSSEVPQVRPRADPQTPQVGPKSQLSTKQNEPIRSNWMKRNYER